MRKQLYLDIKERLKAIKDEQGEDFFKHFGLWNQQVEFIERETEFECPAVFIEFAPMLWKTRGENVQNCDLTVRFHIVTECPAGTPAPEEQLLDFFDIADRTVACLQGFGTDYMSGWQRTQSITNHDHEVYVDSVEEYICNLTDTSAVKPKQTVLRPNVKFNF